MTIRRTELVELLLDTGKVKSSFNKKYKNSLTTLNFPQLGFNNFLAQYRLI